MNQAKPALLTTEEAAGYLNIKPQTLNNWRVTKKVHLPFIRVGRLCRYRMEDLDAFVAARTAGKIEA